MNKYEAMTLKEIEKVKADLRKDYDVVRADMVAAETAHKSKHMQAIAKQALANAGVTGVTITPEVKQVEVETSAPTAPKEVVIGEAAHNA